MIESWNIRNGYSYIFTTSREFSDILKKEFGRGMAYEQNGNIFGWQYLIPTNRVKFYEKMFEKKISEISAITNQGVTARRKRRGGLRDANSISLDKRDIHTADVVREV